MMEPLTKRGKSKIVEGLSFDELVGLSGVPMQREQTKACA